MHVWHPSPQGSEAALGITFHSKGPKVWDVIKSTEEKCFGIAPDLLWDTEELGDLGRKKGQEDRGVKG